MILVSTIGFSRDSSVARKYIRHCIDNIYYGRYLFKVKQSIDIIFYRKKTKFTILVSTRGFSGEPDLVVKPENTLDNALLVKYIDMYIDTVKQ